MDEPNDHTSETSGSSESSGVGGTSAPGVGTGSTDAGGGGISQGDIDALMGGAPAEASTGDSTAAAEAAPPGGEISQDDIDALLGGTPSEASVGDSAVAKAPPPPGEINQDDIDALLGGAPSAAADDASSAPAETTPEPAAVDDRLDSLGRPFDAAAAAMQAAMDTERAEVEATPFEPGEFDSSLPEGVDPKRVTMLGNVKLRLKVQLGRTRMLVEEVLKLGEGSVVELDKLAGDPVDILVNDRLVARGEVLVLNDNFCVRISEVMTHDPHRITT